jgi:molecular chaperone DnaK (HSP70)
MAKSQSRTARWREACEIAREELSNIETAQLNIQSAFETLQELKGEYEDWESTLIDAARGTALEEKLQAVAYLDLEPDTELDLSSIENALDEAEGADLPLGFGRD